MHRWAQIAVAIDKPPYGASDSLILSLTSMNSFLHLDISICLIVAFCPLTDLIIGRAFLGDASHLKPSYAFNRLTTHLGQYKVSMH